MGNLLTRRAVLMARAEMPGSGPVRDGLVLDYTLDTVNWDTLKWSDACGNGSDVIIGAAYSSDRFGMPSTTGSNSKIVSAANFNALCPDSFSIETSSWIGANNFVWSLNSTGGGGNKPTVTAYSFDDHGDSGMIWLGRNYNCRHIVVTYNAETNMYIAYLGGVYKGQVEKTTNISSGFFMLSGWGGNMGTVRVYNRCLSADEVGQNYEYEAKTFVFTD